jgi:hypothetical protein
MKKQVELVNGNFMKLHYKPQKKIVEKAVKAANSFISGDLHARKLSNGLFQVLDISRTERIVIDKEKQLHLMSHEKYNDFVNQR